MARQNTAAQAADDDTKTGHKVVDLMANLQRSLEKATPLPPESATEILRNVLQVVQLARAIKVEAVVWRRPAGGEIETKEVRVYLADELDVDGLAKRLDAALRILESEGAL